MHLKSHASILQHFVMKSSNLDDDGSMPQQTLHNLARMASNLTGPARVSCHRSS